MSSTTDKPIKQRFIIAPGMGCTPINRSNWYCWLSRELTKLGYDCTATVFPDPKECKESIWLNHMINTLKLNENDIVIGHSSGAQAGLRLLERIRVKGLILVAACHTDLGLESERRSGYYNRPWNWNLIKSNAEWIIQLHSENDAWIKVDEGRFVAEALKLGADYHEYPDRNHFVTDDIPELIPMIQDKVNPDGSKPIKTAIATATDNTTTATIASTATESQ